MVRAIDNVIQHGGVLIQGWVDEADNALASGQTLLVDAVDDRSDDGGTGTGARRRLEVTFDEDVDVVTNGRDIGVCSAPAVVDTAVCTKGVVADAFVVGIWRRRVGEESVHMYQLEYARHTQ